MYASPWPQDEAWLATQHVVDGSLRGYAGCIMCYGQTGAGKTYTLGNEKKGSEGIMVRAFKHIFDHATADKEHRYQVSLSYVQVRLLKRARMGRIPPRLHCTRPIL